MRLRSMGEAQTSCSLVGVREIYGSHYEFTGKGMHPVYPAVSKMLTLRIYTQGNAPCIFSSEQDAHTTLYFYLHWDVP